MKIYINDLIDIHRDAFMLDDNEEDIFENILLTIVEHELDYDEYSIYITENTLIKYYTFIMFTFIEKLIS
ncbi:hypothetical protein [Clostridium butyricum]|uniref:hypothetical protein n=1 Tax=Clostridium butyricum TaxID=1492 RepID=UPI0011DDEEA9|nr:hypothetical protein [Clostridium butyricum]MCQ2017141.1 hypothetical protein [Clostridium butyricum]MCQ2023244.1 hypothetical protein [Clostridium butyricum]NFB73489.1 hypothetical protein [Clostridium butyricum]NFB90997.1 hypothetical protein [Clostridium butyricum]UTY53716.1 hypothetical protein HNS01_11650 [Clostridium butyricum]